MRSLFILQIALVALAGCRTPETGQSPLPVTIETEPADTAVERIVFIDLADACECTRKKIDAASAALEKGLGGKDIPVERIHMDTEGQKADVYRDRKSFMVVPALYFLDDGGGILTLLQGDITEKQVVEALYGAL